MLSITHVVDYTQEDFAERDTRYDFILDVVGVRSIKTWKRVLQPEGIYLAAGGSVSQIARTLLLGAWISRRTKKKIGVLGVNFNKKDIATTLELMESGQITATIDRCFPLQDVPEAMRYLGAEHSKGKVMIVMSGR
jgi:NADPH:quinone reductase-like Zn-dependent oxidoreductase